MPSPEQVSPMAAAMQWVSRIFAAAMTMVLPGVAGQWLDEKLGVKFLALLGFGAGLVFGMAYLIAAARQAEKRRSEQSSANKSSANKRSADQTAVSVEHPREEPRQ